MAWVNAMFNHKDVTVTLCDKYINITSQSQFFTIWPSKKEDAHAWALIFRKAARRLEEIGKELE